MGRDFIRTRCGTDEASCPSVHGGHGGERAYCVKAFSRFRTSATGLAKCLLPTRHRCAVDGEGARNDPRSSGATCWARQAGRKAIRYRAFGPRDGKIRRRWAHDRGRRHYCRPTEPRVDLSSLWQPYLTQGSAEHTLQKSASASGCVEIRFNREIPTGRVVLRRRRTRHDPVSAWQGSSELSPDCKSKDLVARGEIPTDQFLTEFLAQNRSQAHLGRQKFGLVRFRAMLNAPDFTRVAAHLAASVPSSPSLKMTVFCSIGS